MPLPAEASPAVAHSVRGAWCSRVLGATPASSALSALPCETLEAPPHLPTSPFMERSL